MMKFSGRNIALVISLVLLMALMGYFSSIVAYVLIAWVLSMIGQPFMRFFQNRLKFGKFQVGPNLAAVLTLLCYFIIIGLMIWIFVPLIVTQANNLSEVEYKSVEQALETPINQINDWLAQYGLKNNTGISLEDQLRQNLSSWFEPKAIGDFFSGLIAAAGNIILSLFSIIFITFFFLKEQGLFVNFLITMAPDQYEEQIKFAIRDISNMLTRYFGGIVIQVTIITLFVSILLGILGIKNALLIGFFAALINVIPYVGPLIGATFGVIITISSNLDLEFYTEMLPMLLKVLVVFGSMQMLDNFLLQPWIFSNSVMAHPLEIFIIILMGAQINGIIGMVLAIPVYTVLRVIARVFLSEFRIVKKITDRMDKMESSEQRTG